MHAKTVRGIFESKTTRRSKYVWLAYLESGVHVGGWLACCSVTLPHLALGRRVGGTSWHILAVRSWTHGRRWWVPWARTSPFTTGAVQPPCREPPGHQNTEEGGGATSQYVGKMLFYSRNSAAENRGIARSATKLKEDGHEKVQLMLLFI